MPPALATPMRTTQTLGQNDTRSVQSDRGPAMNPAEHSARTVDALTDVALEGLPLTDVDRVESLALADAAGDEAESYGAWFIAGEGRPA